MLLKYMKNVLIYGKKIDGREEISELLISKGLKPLFINNQEELLAKIDLRDIKRIFMFIQNLSDIRTLKTIRSLYEDIEISLIIPPRLQEIIELLKNNSFKLMNDITQV